jgi:TetR/AcrR family fatty acid metabolism transcriptional regulator
MAKPAKRKARMRSRTQDASRPGAREQQILDAAVRVFARKGFHTCRVSDIAREADVAYGLVYHYFTNKDEILNSIFHRNWSVVVNVMESVAKEQPDLRSRVGAIIDFVMNAYKISPDTVDVLVMEFGRSSRLAQTMRHPTLDKSFAVLHKIMLEGQARGEVSRHLEARLLTMLFLGMLESGLAAFVTRILPRDEAVLDAMKNVLIHTFLEGVAPSAQRGACQQAV